MTATREALRSELLNMAAEDLRVRERLAKDGALFDGYHPVMERVHLQNAERLTQIIDTHGWPDRRSVGSDAAAAAWLVLQHAISCPDLQRRGLSLLKAASAHGGVDPAHVAMLEDRIRVFEGRPQVYGTQHDWDAQGELSPGPIENADNVDARRAQVGLPPLAENTERLRDEAAREGQHAPLDFGARREAMEVWARGVGWRD